MSCDRFCMKSGFASAWEAESLTIEPMTMESPPHLCTRLHMERSREDFACRIRPSEFETPSDHHTLLLQTAPRPKSVLAGTAASLRLAGSDEWLRTKILCSDGPVAAEDLTLFLKYGWKIDVTNNQRGSARAFGSALRLALYCDPKLDRLTFIEDDVAMSRHTLDCVARLKVPDDIAFISWFFYDYDWSEPKHPLPNPHPASLEKSVLACRPARYFILNQACTYPRRTIDRLLRCPMLDEWPKRNEHDELVAWILGDSPYAIHFPILVQHTGGLDSAVSLSQGQTDGSGRGPRTSPHFAGSKFDARTLLTERK